MTRDGRATGFGRALALAPLAAPAAVLVGTAVRALISPRHDTAGIDPIVGVLFLAAILLVYGSPLAYVATLVILWPIAALLRDAEAFTWWSLTLVAMVAGGLLFPLYLHAFDPRASWGFFPGAGAAAGAATGWCFWFIAAAERRRPPQGP